MVHHMGATASGDCNENTSTPDVDEERTKASSVCEAHQGIPQPSSYGYKNMSQLLSRAEPFRTLLWLPVVESRTPAVYLAPVLQRRIAATVLYRVATSDPTAIPRVRTA